MKIAFLCNEYPPCLRVGGIGVFTHTIAHGLVDAGHEVTVLGYGKDHGERDDRGVRIVILPQSATRRISWFINLRRLYCWLKREARAGRIDILETPEYQGPLPCSFPWCPVVVRLHTAFLPERKLQRILEKRTLKIHKKWIGVSGWIIRETQEKYDLTPAHEAVVYNPVNASGVDATIPVDLPNSFVLYAGAVSEGKGAFVLADAARKFLLAHPDLYLVYIGALVVENGRRADETVRHILGEELAPRVHFTGPVEHDIVLACMRKAKVFAFPSKLEAFGLVPVEAMSCGVPVVYSTLHAGPEVIDDGITGLLADPYSSDDVAEKVQRILNDSEFGAQLSKNAKHAVKERFSLQRCIDDTLKFYRDISDEQQKECRND